ncbi:MAG: TetR/AcrR family transcriptional regulator [Planctomycetota bacterium]
MREQILDAAERLVQNRGLSAVSFQDLADAVGLRKASLFHHIKNKDELGRLLIQRCGSKHGPRYAAVIEQDTDAPAKLRGIARLFENDLHAGEPCLMAALGSSLDALSGSAVAELGAAAQVSVARFALVFAQGRREGSLAFEGSAEDAAMGFFAMLEGLQTLCRAKGDVSSFGPCVATYIQAVTVSEGLA